MWGGSCATIPGTNETLRQELDRTLAKPGPISGNGITMSDELRGKIAFITGAAGSGIGRATAFRLARDGASVIVTDIHAERTARTVNAIKEEIGAPVVGYTLDVSDRNAIEQVFSVASTDVGDIDILINNAAINAVEPVEAMTMRDWDTTLEADLRGPFDLIRRCLPAMKRNGWGSIVNITSVAAFTSPSGEAPYAASKSALHSLTRTIAAEVGPYGIRCNSIAPGLVWTKFLEKHVDLFTPEIERTPLRRFGQPEDVADVVGFLVSEQSRFITGETLVVSGGWYMSS